jgi:hypothetical protein
MARRSPHPWLFVLTLWLAAGAFVAGEVALGVIFLIIAAWLLVR